MRWSEALCAVFLGAALGLAITLALHSPAEAATGDVATVGTIQRTEFHDAVCFSASTGLVCFAKSAALLKCGAP